MFEAKFFDTYYFCNIIRNILNHQIEYLRNLNEFYGDEAIYSLIDPFQKYSAFHRFIEFIVDEAYYEEAFEVNLPRMAELIERYKNIPEALKDLKVSKLPIEIALEYHSIPHVSFDAFLAATGKSMTSCDENDVYEYMSELRGYGEYDRLVSQTVKEVFYVLFQNRNLMMIFNKMMSNVLENEIDSNPPCDKLELFARPGILKRQVIPKWVKRAVFFRDRGCCVLCNRDLTGIINIENRENYDHIFPLAQHGLNDVSNIQLLCKECNQIEKRDGTAITSNKYQSWYPYD